MNKKLKQVILFTGLSVAMLTAGSSFAARMEGSYVSGNLAATWLQAQNYQLQSSALPNGAHLHLPNDTGWGGGLAVGSQYRSYRMEAALDYLTNKVKNAAFSAPGIPLVPVQAWGRISAITLMVNGYYDFMPNAAWTSYLGVGLGEANIRPRVNTFQVGSSTSGRVRGSANKFAYQGIAGVSWKVTDRVKANIDYHYLSTSEASFTATSSNGGMSAPTTRLKSRYTNNRVTAGMTYYFD